MRFIQLAAAVALLLPTGVAAAHTTQPHPVPAVVPLKDQSASGYAQTILTKVNELRTSKGLVPVTRYRELDAIATDWSQQMASRASMSHRPNFADHYPSGWTSAAENVAMRGGSGDIGALIFDQWLNSPGHYANMVNPDLNSIGIGLAHDPVNNAWYATQNFASYSDGEAAALTRVTGESPRPTPSPPPSNEPPPPPSPEPAPSPTKESTPPPKPSPSPSQTPSTSPTPGQESDPAPGGTDSPKVALPRELTEDSDPANSLPATRSPAATSESEPTSDPVPESVSPPPATPESPTPSADPAPTTPPAAAVAELDESGPPWGMIAIGGVLVGTGCAGLVFLIRRLV